MKEHFNKKEVIDKITPVIENTGIRHNLIPLEISLEKENNNWFLRIFIYSPEHPVNHLDCEHITNGLGDLLDELIPFKYYLEVSSPGLDRKMKSAREYIIFKGRNVVVKVKNPLEEGLDKKIFAKIADYKEGIGLTIITNDTNREYTIPLDNIFSVRLDEINNKGDKI